MSFTVACGGDKCHASNAQPVVVLRYQGQAVGAPVTDAVARNAKRASGCWAGTTESHVDLPLTVTFFADTIFDRKTQSMRIWADPQVAVVPATWETTWHGGLGTQDEVQC
jgi:hypothetical protein